MKNTEKDYITQLRSDFIPRKKGQHDNFRRPFNPGDPNEFLFMPVVQPLTGEANTKSTFSTAALSSAELFKRLPENIL